MKSTDKISNHFKVCVRTNTSLVVHNVPVYFKGKTNQLHISTAQKLQQVIEDKPLHTSQIFVWDALDKRRENKNNNLKPNPICHEAKWCTKQSLNLNKSRCSPHSSPATCKTTAEEELHEVSAQIVCCNDPEGNFLQGKRCPRRKARKM